jgi:hypothetical protein
LPELRHQAVPAVPARPAIGQCLPSHARQAQRVIKFPKSQQAGIRSDPRPVKLQPQAAVKIDPQITRFRFTRGVRHEISLQDRSSC